MKKEFLITEDYLYIPVKKGAQEKEFCFYIQSETGSVTRWTQFDIPVDTNVDEKVEFDFLAEIPIGAYKGKTLLIEADVRENFLETIFLSEKKELSKFSNMKIHFATKSGWTNDPNGLVYENGTYHLYYQYNPMNVIWNNMSWGHAVSQDLLHWKEMDMVMLPDEDGEMYSGCGMVNTREELGLPKDALIFFYTEAGTLNSWSKEKPFVQKIAYSTDHGKTFVKLPDPCLEEIYFENRDPKLFWHEPSKAYVMVLYIKDNEFGIFRSVNLKEWKQTQIIVLEGAWECPDLFFLKSDEGEGCWFFWTADGFYYAGNFDGYQFSPFQAKRCAYLSKLPYAAQTYSNTGDRIVSIPWLRIQNDGRNYTGAYGIPVELSFEKTKDEEYLLIQRPVRELTEQMMPVTDSRFVDRKDKFVYNGKECKDALVVKMYLNSQFTGEYFWTVNGMTLRYSVDSGIFTVGSEKMTVGYPCSEVMMIIDDRILEIFFDNGKYYGAFVLDEDIVYFETETDVVESCEFYTVG